MANTLDGSSFAEHYLREAQDVDQVEPVYRAICKYNAFPAEFLSFGDKINLPKTSALYVNSYTRGTAVVVQDLTNSIDYLTINQQNEVSFYVDDFDAKQQTIDAAVTYGGIAGKQLVVEKDAVVLGEYGSATHTVKDTDISAGSAVGFTPTVDNIYKMFTIAKKKMSLRSIGLNMLFAVISPNIVQLLEEYLINRGTPLADDQLSKGYTNGFKGRIPLLGIDIFESNDLTNTFKLIMSSDITDEDTIALNFNDYSAGATTVTITFQSALTGGAATNEVLLGANVAATRVNLVALINATAGDTTLYEEFSATVRDQLRNLVATDNLGTENSVGFVWKGSGTITLTESITAAADVFTAAYQIQHQLIGVKGATNVACQIEPKMRVKDVPDKFGSNFLNGQLWGLKTATDGARRLVDVQTRFDGTGF